MEKLGDGQFRGSKENGKYLGMRNPKWMNSEAQQEVG